MDAAAPFLKVSPGAGAGASPSAAPGSRFPVRFVTATALFDGHDASITIMRRILLAQGCEVVHLGHDRSVAEVVRAAVQEDAQGIAVSSYQGGHLEYFRYLVAALAEQGAHRVTVFGGGGGVITATEVSLLAGIGVRIFTPADGQQLGLTGMVAAMIRSCDREPIADPSTVDQVATGSEQALARMITMIEAGRAPGPVLDELRARAAGRRIPVLGVTGTGGSGKSSVTDELLHRLQHDGAEPLTVAVLAVDPTRRRGGGALLGDRIRMNSLIGPGIFFRSMATRGSARELPGYLPEAIAACTVAGYDLVIVETPGIGQGDAAITSVADVTVYVMTPEFGAVSQLEKIDVLDVADVVAVNKYERSGGPDARRDVARQLLRNRGEFGADWRTAPVFGTSAARFNDDGITALYQRLRDLLAPHGLPQGRRAERPTVLPTSPVPTSVVPPARTHHLARIARTVRNYHARTAEQAALARRRQHLVTAQQALADRGESSVALDALVAEAEAALAPETRAALARWPALRAAYQADDVVFPVRGRDLRRPLRRTTPSGNSLPRVALPRGEDHAAWVTFAREENLPGRFPFTAGVFPLSRDTEPPTRMFAGEGDPFRSNRRFRLLSDGQPAVRLSTAFDAVTLYGRDPDPRPDIYGKIGTSGVSVATVDDVRELYRGFDLCAPTTSVSMTINGPAPAILAMFLTVAIEQQQEAFTVEHGRPPTSSEAAEVSARVLATVRGTVQADILKEDQGQNTCLFSTEFSLRAMADIQEWFIAHRVRNFYAVSISGYHLAEAGANPVTQLAFTLANAFTYVEIYLARGLAIDDFASNLSFFFSNGMDAEYAVLGRVARRIWAIALRDVYGAGERSQRLKYHVQTSGRSLHAQEMGFNDIRTTLQALCAVYDNANSLHTNAYDEAVTTPTESSVRRALAIQLILDAEWGLSGCENPLQGSALIDELTDLVTDAVLAELERLDARGGVLGAMETGYQRGRIQEESLRYEQAKHDGTLPIVGVNTFLAPEAAPDLPRVDNAPEVPLARGTEAERRSQLERVVDFRSRHAAEAPAALARLAEAATSGGNLFAALMDAVPVCSLGQITETFFAVGGRYRRAL